MNNKKLIVSIITVCYNAEKFIENAIQSVLSQDYKNIEYIIVDGGSTDKTLEIVNTYKDKIAKVISERDKGIYDAMNKGIAVSTGEILYFLNSDDRLYDPTVISKISNEFDTFPEIGVAYGKVLKIDQSFQIKQTQSDSDISELHSRQDIIMRGVCQQRFFARKYLFNRYGLFNISYKVCADVDWILRLVNNKITFKFINIPVAYVYSYGVSHVMSKKRKIEKNIIILKQCSLIEISKYIYKDIYRKFFS